MTRPGWWNWPLELTAHVRSRMVERAFSEVDLRRMLHQAEGLRPGRVSGRWIVRTHNDGEDWEVVVEPDHDRSVLVVVTAYPLTG